MHVFDVLYASKGNASVYIYIYIIIVSILSTDWKPSTRSQSYKGPTTDVNRSLLNFCRGLPPCRSAITPVFLKAFTVVKIQVG